jgi:hypothetical protein
MKYKKIFFSYSRTDKDFAVKLASDLKKDSYDVWIDQEDIRAGSEWDMEIEKALTTCDCIVFIQSDKSAALPNVLDEVYYALEEIKTVIPVIINESKAPFRIKRLEHISFIDNYEAGLKNVKDNLSGAVLPELNDKSFEKKPLSNIIGSKYLIGLLLLVVLVTAIFYFMRSSNNTSNKTDVPAIANEDFTGSWALANMRPGMTEKKGYLKIEDAGSGKLNIKTSVQFYFKRTNDTAYLEVFNSFAECNGCILKGEITLDDNQVDVGAHRYITLKENESGKGKAGDTVLNAGLNKAVRAVVTLHLSKDNVFIKIAAADSTNASYGIIIPPFAYTFFFKKDI